MPQVPAWRTSRLPAAASEASRRGPGRQLPVTSPHMNHSCQECARRKAQEARNSGLGYPRTSAIGCPGTWSEGLDRRSGRRIACQRRRAAPATPSDPALAPLTDRAESVAMLTGPRG